MYKLRDIFRGKKPLKRPLLFIVTFCVLAIAAVVAGALYISADEGGDYIIDISTNDTTMGLLGLGNDCSGTKVASYHESVTYNYDIFPNTPNGKITACPETGYKFDHWLLEGAPLSNVGATIERWSANYTNHQMNLEAVFVPTSSVVVTSAHGNINVYNCPGCTLTDNGTGQVTITFTGSDINATVGITPDTAGGYNIDPNNPVTISGNDASYSNYSNNQFTLTLNGSDQVTINYLSQYSVDIYSSNGGTASASGTDITVSSGDHTDHVSLTTIGSNKTATVYAQAPSGYEINASNPVTTTGSVVYNNDYNNGQFTLTLNGAGSATINYGRGYTVTVQSDDSTHGTISIPTGNNYIATPDGTSSGSVSLETTTFGNVTTSTVTTIPASGYFFDGFTSANDATASTETGANSFTLGLTGDDTVTANFTAYSDIIYTVSVNNPAVGSIDITGSNCSNSTSQSFTRSLVPFVEEGNQSYYRSSLDTNGNDIVACLDDNNYRFSHWLIDGNMNVSSNTTLDKTGYWPKNGSAHTLQAIFVPDFYDVTFTVNDATKGQIWMNNTQSEITMNVANGTRVPVSGGEQSLVLTVHCNGDCVTGRVTNSLMVKGLNDYRFHHFEISNNNAVVSTPSPSEGKYGFTITGTSSVVAVFGKYVNYAPTTVNGTTINPVDPSSGQVKVDEDIEGTVTGATIDPNSIPVGAVYMGWADENGSIVSGSDQSYTFVPSGSQLEGEPTYHPVLEEVTIYYTSGTAGETTISPIDTSGATKTSEGGFNPTGVRIDTNSIPAGYKFAGWANENDVIVSTSVNFTPSGANQIYAGAAYHPVFTTALIATFTSNDGGSGQLGYIGWEDKCSNGEPLVSTTSFFEDNEGKVGFPYNEIKACPVGDNVFLGWSLDGGSTFASNTVTANKWEQWLQFNGQDLNIMAVFAPGIPYTISVNIPAAGSIDAQGGSCADSTKKTNQSWDAYLVEENGTKTLDTYVSDSSVFQACVDNNDYQFDYWQIDNSIHASTATTLDKTNSGWPNQAGYHSLRAMFGTEITYLDGIVDGDSTKTVATVDPADGNTSKHSELSSSATGATFSSSSLSQHSGAKFVGWEDVTSGCTVPQCPIVSTNTTFIPSGDQLYVGATYQPVFVTDSNYTEVLAADPDTGYIAYWSDSQSQWVGRTDNGEFHVATVNGYVDGGIKAMPRDGYIFDHWEYEGTTICTSSTSDCDEIVDNEVTYRSGSGNSMPRLVAYFVPATAKYHVFTGYTGANGYFDHDLPETRRTGGVGAQAGKVTLTYYSDADSDIPGAYADFSGDQHSTAPNGYYFAYWVTGCNTDYNYTEMVQQGTGNEDEMNALGSETIVSFDQSFRPTRAQTQVCDEYIAVFYRKNQLRLIAQSENEAIGVVNATTTSSSELYQELCDNTLMRVKANLGVGVNVNGYYSSCDATAVVTAPAYRVSSWTFNGYTVLDAATHEPVTRLAYRGEYVVEDNGNYVSLANVIVGDDLNYLVAHFEIVPLPFTGSSAIWLLVGGGVGLVAIPSIILIVNERKEQKKGGKK